MILDINLTLDSNRALTVTAASTNVIDIAGVGVGVAPPNKFGTAATFGEDIGGSGPGAGGSNPQVIAQVGTAFTAGGSATMRVQLQCAVDTVNTYQPGTWDTIAQTDDVAVALLTAGAKVCNFSIPNRYLGQGQPRYYRLNYVITTGPMLSGTIGYAGILTGVDDIEIYPAAY